MISFKPTWLRGVFIIGYFFFLALISTIPFLNAVFVALAWPNFVIPWTWLASIVQVLFVYVLAVLVTAFWPKRRKKTHK